MHVTSSPRDDWTKLTELTAELDPEVKGLTLVTDRQGGGARLILAFTEPNDTDDEEYPIDTHLLVFARFRGHPETRMLKVPVVVGKPKNRPHRELRPLKDDPTFLKVASRQPVKLVAGGGVGSREAAMGRPGFSDGSPPPWKFTLAARPSAPSQRSGSQSAGMADWSCYLTRRTACFRGRSSSSRSRPTARTGGVWRRNSRR